MPYTMRTYMAEVMQRLDRYTVASQVDPGMLETLINQARHNVQLATLQLVPERYARVHVPAGAAVVSLEESARSYEYDATIPATVPVITLVGEIPLPQDFIDPVAVFVTDEDDVEWPARLAEKRELYTVLTKSFTKPSPTDPVYCIEKRTDATAHRLLISTGTVLPDAGTVSIWYLAKLPYLQAAAAGNVDDTETRIGYDLQELVVLLTMMNALTTMGLPDSVQIISQFISALVMGIQNQYEGSVDRRTLLYQAREGTILNQFSPTGRM